MNATASILETFWRGMALHLWQTTIFITLMFIAARFLRSAPAFFQNLLWRAALLKLLLPLPLLGPLFFRLFPGTWPDIATGSSPLAKAPARLLASVYEPTVFVQVLANMGPTRRTETLVLSALTLLWLAGAARFVRMWAREARGARQQRRTLLARAGSRAPDERVGSKIEIGAAGAAQAEARDAQAEARDRLEAALAGTKISNRTVHLSAGSTMPATVGVLRPAIHVSEAMVLALEREELRGVLLHEHAHCRRRDPLFRHAGHLAAALFWFYPLLRPALRRLRITEEIACDEEALAAGVSAPAYAAALTRAVSLGLEPLLGRTAFAAAAGPDGSFRQRLERIAARGRFTIMPRHKIIAAVAVYGVLAGFLVPRFERSEALASIVWAPGGPGSRPRIGASLIDDLDFAVVRIEHLAVPPFDLALADGAHWRNSSARAIAVIVLVAMDADGNVLDAAPGPIVWYGKDGTYIQETYPKSLIQSGMGKFRLVSIAMDAVLRSDLKFDDAVNPIPGRSYQGEIEIQWPIPEDGRLSGGEVKVEHGRSGDIAILGAPITVEGNATGAQISVEDNVIGAPVTVEGSITPPQLIEKVNPVYPPDAREAKAEGKIILEAVIDTDGSVISTKVLRGNTEFPSLEESAIDAVRKWRYKPATDREGVPVKVYFTVMIEYTLE